MLKNLLIVAIALILSAVAGSVTVGAIAKSTAADYSLSLVPLNGFAAENVAAGKTKALVAQNQGQFPDRVDAEWYNLAVNAFEAEPVTPEAIAVIALSRSDDDRRELMQKAFKLSRRQQVVTGWMIMDSGVRQDIPAVLRLYDTTLRTSRPSADVVIPIMANALVNDSFVEPFAGILSQSPPWAPGFWAQVIATPAALGNAANLRELLYRDEEADLASQDAALINALAYNGQFEKAEHLYSFLVRPEERKNLIRNGHFASGSKYPPIDWQLFSTGEYGAVISDGKLQLSAISNSGGLFARQLVKLPANAIMEVIPESKIPNDSKIFVSLSCAETIDGAPQAIRIPLKGKIANLQINNSQSRCRFYWLDLNGRASENGDGFDIAIDSISIQ